MTAGFNGLPATTHLRIAVISDAIPERNGVGTYYVDLVEHLKEHVSQVKMISPGKNGKSLCGRLVFSMPGDKTQRICVPNYRNVSHQIKQLKPHIIIAPTPGPFGLLAIRWAKQNQARMISGLHTDFRRLSDLYSSPFFGLISKKYIMLSHKLLFRNSSAVLAISPDMIEAAEEIGTSDIRLMGTFLPYSYLHTPINSPPLEIKRIVFAGRLAPEKNLEAIFQAVAKLPDHNFFIAGDGPLRKQVKEKAASHQNLHYLGWQCRQELMHLFDHCDMLVLPSLVESFGTVALEAMVRARPVLLSNTCGMLRWPELRNKVLTIGENEQLYQAIVRVSSIPGKKIQDIASQGREAALILHRWSLVQWLHLLAEPCMHE